jgi:cytochrome c oxidase subunit 3
MSEASATREAHGHPPYLQHHFETPLQQFDSGKLGMWLFLATEVVLFGGLFCAYAIYRGRTRSWTRTSGRSTP